ncbi:MAG: Hpt domain-containing protein [Candidatus Omnitrophota bacterium]
MSRVVINFEDAMDRVQDDMELLFELFDIFQQDFIDKRPLLEQYICEKNAEEVRNVAHSMKGAAGNISAEKLFDVCLMMEKNGSQDNFETMAMDLSELDGAFKEFQQEAARIRKENG